MNRRETIKLFAFAAPAILVGCGPAATTYRFRMTIEIATAQGLETGSSVMEVRASRGMAIGDTSGVSAVLHGQAVVVDLPDGPVFALLKLPDAGPSLASVINAALFGKPIDTPDAVIASTAKLGSTWLGSYKIRNATIRVNYAGVRFLVDPMFADPGAYPGFPGSAMSHLRNPLVPLPVAVADLVDADAVIVTHTHIDHWDDAAQKALPKAIPIFVQNATDAATIRGQGFSDVRIMTTDTRFKGVQLARTGGHHGGDAVLRAVPTLDPVSGVVFRHQSHKSVYVVGDTIWDAAVAQAVETYKPDVIVLNAGYAQWVDLGPILMGPQGVLSVHRAAPTAQLVATHMEAINHCVLSRADLAAFAKKEGFAQRLLIPADGENISI